MTRIYSVHDLKRVARQELEPPPCDQTLQVKVHEASDGIAQGVWTVDHQYINGLGVAMGGFLASAADIMMAYAITSRLSDDQGFASIDLQTTFHRPTVQGEVEIEARVERLGRKLAYLVADLHQHDKKVASCVSSMLITSNE
ncbi:PaaI family thioesterase [Lentibacillus saliphilus]|uniref:PaaI family thioesterase n=1 Tax=Lentibacillus saliphilus TaxID=2737028 RepID=UPI001C2F6129|nr:PaaI family thioesterase [Lentibacillus saliphilus]